MRKLTVMLASFIIATQVGSTAFAQAGFLFGVATGAVLFGESSSGSPGNGVPVLYVLPHVSERVTEPLEVKLASTPILDFSADCKGSRNFRPCTRGESLLKLFSRAVPQTDRYEILQAVRALDATVPVYATIWFAYIEKGLVRPLKEPRKK